MATKRRIETQKVAPEKEIPQTKIDIRILSLGILAFLFLIFYAIGKKPDLPSGKVINTKPLELDQLPVSPEPLTGKPEVRITTTRGSFTIELRPDLAQNTVVNFLNKWSAGYCNTKTFHRVEDWVIQGCDPNGNGTGGSDTLPTETSKESFLAGSVGVARKMFPADKSNDSQFFILKKDSTFLNSEYTYFGKVISGMDVVNSIKPGDTINSTEILTK